MATPAHCLYCFECLSAALDRRKFPSLSEVEESWDAYQDAKTRGNPGDPKDTQMTDAEDEDEDDDDDDLASQPEDDKDVIVDGTGKRIPLQGGGRLPDNTQRPSATLAPPTITSHRIASPSSGSSSSLPSIKSKSSGTSSITTRQTSLASSRTSLSQTDAGESYSGAAKRAHVRAPDSPMFVTWNIASRTTGQKNLRGCIGTFEKQNLNDGLRTYALTSAFEDHRFNPIAATEVPRLSVSVTLLTDFESCSHPTDWELGTHGIRIAFTWHGKRYGATYLPDVAKEQGWSKSETLISLMRKAGWTGLKDSWSKVLDGTAGCSGALGWGKKGEQAEVTRYQGRKIGLGYEEWDAWREWSEAKGLL
ncbi:MAG: hypothetical protein Q9159_007690 [Coniocarpon cinnabarinum]